MAIAKLKRK